MGWGGLARRNTGMMMMMNVEERIRFLLRTAIRAEGTGNPRIADLFRRMAEDMRTGESALLPIGPVLGVVAE